MNWRLREPHTQEEEDTAIRLKGLFARPRRFRGGVYLPTCEPTTLGKPIEPFPRPGRLAIPLAQPGGSAAFVVVAVGQPVAAGDLVGRGEAPASLNAHAPLAGRVVAVTRVVTGDDSDCPAVLIESTETHEPRAPDLERCCGPQPCDLQLLASVADDAGIPLPGSSGIALGEHFRRAQASGTSDVIVNGLVSEPTLTAGRQVLMGHLQEVVASGVWVRNALGAKHLWLAMDRSDRELVARCRAATKGTPMRIATLRNRYPQAAPALLTWAITGRETPYGQRPTAVHALVVESESLVALADAVRQRRPMVDRVITVAGPAVQRPGHYRIPVGTSVADILRHVGLSRPVARVIHGGPMTGRAVATLEAVVTKQTPALFVMDHESDHIPAPGPCIRCGWCQDDCPVGLAPHALLDTFERDDLKQASSLHPHACLGCGLCSYVCPAELALSESVTGLQRLIPVN